MTAYYNEIVFGDCRDTMRRWAAEGVKAQMCVTSPPCHIGQAKQTVSGSDAGRDSHANRSADKGADFGTHQGTEK